jgi:hypothetical protein
MRLQGKVRLGFYPLPVTEAQPDSPIPLLSGELMRSDRSLCWRRHGLCGDHPRGSRASLRH